MCSAACLRSAPGATDLLTPVLHSRWSFQDIHATFPSVLASICAEQVPHPLLQSVLTVFTLARRRPCMHTVRAWSGSFTSQPLVQVLMRPLIGRLARPSARIWSERFDLPPRASNAHVNTHSTSCTVSPPPFTRHLQPFPLPRPPPHQCASSYVLSSSSHVRHLMLATPTGRRFLRPLLCVPQPCLATRTAS